MRPRPRTGGGGLRSRPRLRSRAIRVRVYDVRGQPHSLDPGAEPGRTLVAHAEALVRAGLAPRS